MTTSKQNLVPSGGQLSKITNIHQGLSWEEAEELFSEDAMFTYQEDEDPFWDSLKQLLRASQTTGTIDSLPHGMLTDSELEYWKEVAETRDLPDDESELDEIVKRAKVYVQLYLKRHNGRIVDCWIHGLIASLEEIEGYWPYA